ncbi:RsmB/NOP family class I SAM-dependent RNA methyltransferase [Paracoccus sp. (in: a-proteobacteria)]|uniref:RsmB/NOP family class I SAM-dependent RNA methyltransferase n=1 Tax=Paracoccus sp. TaxID=267 RepID=UPI0026DF598B|nr:RsmB/NOP family class I SAM-dependent RNA methyltransferase [Paracoccus sp. (in: a-proteobacteria)]MDO5646655.1 RsmB/NOP family class I SAM-dependent RNA methyltransferase [Paracoccus sp. (in: a-proteobacteria)]
MTPAARISAAITILDDILTGTPAEASLLRWSRASRFAGSGDRAAVRDLVFQALRQRGSLSARGGRLSGRGLMIGLARAQGHDPAGFFTGQGHAPAVLTGDERHDPGAPDDPLIDLPDWLRPIWQASLGDQAAAVAAAMTDRAPVWLRVNTARATPAQAMAILAADGVDAQPHPDLPTALRVTAGDRKLAGGTAYRDGVVELQDLSPQLACAALPRAARVLDYCAGGGGKSLAIAARDPGAQVFAHDADPARMGDLPARAARAGARITVGKPKGHYDLVVADVPCSGSGTWRRTPDAKWRLTREKLTDLIELQAQILDQIAPLVTPGGHLVYMTCSLFDGENARQINAFTARHSDFSVVADRRLTPDTGSDGFYYAILQRIKAGAS